MSAPSAHDARLLDDAALRRWPLPQPDAAGDKEHRGRVLVIAGCAEMPGAAVLAATAALRAGAGKLVIAAPADAAPWIAMAMPEARVIGLPERKRGGLVASGADLLARIASQSQAVLVGPGMQNETATAAFTLALRSTMEDIPLLLDACAMQVAVTLGRDTAHCGGLLVTPHLGEMAHLCGDEKDSVQADAPSLTVRAARAWNAVVALKGAVTFIGAPDGRLWRHERGNVGLATSGSGDTLAGLIAGLAARGAPLEQAAGWGVALHARAGERLAQRIGPLGYLAREIAAEVPALMKALE
jgi:ADP-dependent NAD(P)H-hydrate dehydratase